MSITMPERKGGRESVQSILQTQVSSMTSMACSHRLSYPVDPWTVYYSFSSLHFLLSSTLCSSIEHNRSRRTKISWPHHFTNSLQILLVETTRKACEASKTSLIITKLEQGWILAFHNARQLAPPCRGAAFETFVSKIYLRLLYKCYLTNGIRFRPERMSISEKYCARTASI